MDKTEWAEIAALVKRQIDEIQGVCRGPSGKGERRMMEESDLLEHLLRRQAESEERIARLEKLCEQYHAWFEQIAGRPLKDSPERPRFKDQLDPLRAEMNAGFKATLDAIARLVGTPPK